MRYQYQALDTQGQEVSGIIEAKTEREATRQLQKRELTPLVLKQTTTSQRGKAGKPKQRDVLVAFHELATLLESEVSLIDTVESLAESSHHPFITQTFSDVAAKLRQGTSFSKALQESELSLPWYVIQLAEAGELTGKIAEALRAGVEQMEYDARIKSEMRNAMFYPAILIFSGITAVLLIFIVVVPRFANILKNREEGIPWLAKAVLNTGMFFNHYYEWIIGGIVLLVIALSYALTQARLLNKLKDFSAKLPLIGVWLMESETARWASMMGTLLDNRVPLLRSLELSSQGIQLPSLFARLTQVNKSVKAGTHLSQALQDNDALTPTGHNLIRAGEKAGQLPRMLRSLARLLEESGRVRMKRFLLLIEPLAIVIIGSVIGVIITGIILAITSVNKINF